MKRLSTLLLLTLSTLSLMATPVKEKEAAQVATHFWSAVSNMPVTDLQIVRQSDFTQFYIFDINQGGGFVIVSADDAAYPVLGYSTNTPAGDLGPETRFWLGQYAAEIDALAAGTVEVEPALAEYVRSHWTQLLQGTWQQPKTATSVAQLLTTQWNQSPYYNALCPTGTPVGCAATATAQVMKYWNHPVVGNGSHSYYEDDYGTLSADFGNTTYDWDNMPNRLSSYSSATQRTAVATLCYHVGVAIEMDYSPDGSGAQVIGSYRPSSESALVDYFNYENTISGIQKSSYSDAQWVDILKGELDAARPIVYAGYDDAAGHAFVFDGYDANSQFHVNWGWGGSYDGYYAVGALNPGGGGVGSNTSNTFNYYNQALIGIQPKPTLAAIPSTLLFDVNGGSTSFEVRSDYGVSANWTASTDASWLTLSPTTGLGSGSITTVQATATAITTGHSRTATITLVQNQDTVWVPVYQYVCQQSDRCTLTVNMTDRSSDGWDGAYLSFESTEGVVYGTASLNAGSYGTTTVAVCPDTVLVRWHGSSTAGSDSQCEYFVENAEGRMWIYHEAQTALAETDTIVSPCAATGGEPTFTFSLSLSANDTAYGDVLGADSNVHFGETRPAQAVAKPGYRFVRWNDYIYDNPRNVLLIRDRELVARFEDLGDDTLHYDNGKYYTAVNGDDGFAWGIRFGVDQLVGHRELEGVKFYCASRGNYTVKVYQNATNQPLVQVGEQTEGFNYYAIGKWQEITFDTPITINHSRPLWIVFSSPNANTPAAMTTWGGNVEGCWFTEGNGWSSLTELDNPIYGTWMIRAVMPLDPEDYTLTITSTRPSWGTVTGGGRYRYGQRVAIEALPTEGHHFVRWSDHNTDNPRTVVVKSDSIIRAVFAEGELGIDDFADAGMEVCLQGQQLQVRGAEGLPVSVYDALGRCLYASDSYDGRPVDVQAAGVYMVRVATFRPRKVVVAAQ